MTFTLSVPGSQHSLLKYSNDTWLEILHGPSRRNCDRTELCIIIN